MICGPPDCNNYIATAVLMEGIQKKSQQPENVNFEAARGLKSDTFDFCFNCKRKKGGKSAIRGGGLMTKVMKNFHFFGSLPLSNLTDDESTNLSKNESEHMSDS